MRLSDLVDLIKEEANEENPVIKVIIPNRAGFVELNSETLAVLNRKEYYDEGFFGTEFSKESYVVLDFCV